MRVPAIVDLNAPSGVARPREEGASAPARALQRARSVWRRGDAKALLALAAVVLALWLPRLEGPIDLRYDAGVYYILGTSIAQGEGYRLLNEPGAPMAVQYPPALPALVALHQLALGSSDVEVVGPALRGTYFLLYAAYVLAVYALARRFMGAPPAFVVALVTSLYLFSFYLADLLFAELPFALTAIAFFLVSGVGVARRPARAGSPADAAQPPTASGAESAGEARSADAADGGWRFVLTALLASLAFLLRTAGIALLAAWIVEAALARRWRTAALRLAVALIPIVAWQGYIAQVKAEPTWDQPAYAYQRAPYQYYNVTYGENALLIDPFTPELGHATPAGLVLRGLNNLAVMPRSLGEGVSAGAGWWRYAAKRVQERVLGRVVVPEGAVLAPIAILGGLVLAGLGLLVVRGGRSIALFVGASLALICLTPWPSQFTRYLAPLTPFLVLALGLLLVELRRRSRRAGARWRLPIAAAAALVIASVLGVELFTVARTFKLRHDTGHTVAVRGAAPIAAAAIADRSGPRLFYYDDTWAAFDACLAWLRAHEAPALDAPPPAQGAPRPLPVVASVAPHWAYIETGLPAVMPPMEADPTRALALMDTVPVRYLIVDELEFLDIARRYGGPAVEYAPGGWEQVYTAPGTRTSIYRRTLD